VLVALTEFHVDQPSACDPTPNSTAAGPAGISSTI
jgi:hypothetical protein